MKMIKCFLFLLAVLEATEPLAQRWINEFEKVTLTQKGTKPLETKIFSTAAELQEKIRDVKAKCFKMSDFTKQQANSKFGQTLLKKIKNRYFKKGMESKVNLHQVEWDPKSQEQFTKILKKYFAELLAQHAFQDVLHKILGIAKELNQIPKKSPNCFKAKYEGKLKALFDGENAQNSIPEQISRKEIFEWIKKIFLNKNRAMQVFHNNETLFGGSRTYGFVKEGTNMEELNDLKHSGSLDTYSSKTENKGFLALMNLFKFAEEVVKGEDELTIAERAYLIWKTTGYSTPDHQDVHQAQHLVTYHQLRGEAFFHILPPICGLLLAELYNSNRVDEIKEALRFFNDKGIGHYTYLKTGEVIFLPPDMTHFVQVPFVAGNEQIDFVRAFEILFDYESMRKKAQQLEEKKPEISAGQKLKRKRSHSKFSTDREAKVQTSKKKSKYLKKEKKIEADCNKPKYCSNQPKEFPLKALEKFWEEEPEIEICVKKQWLRAKILDYKEKGTDDIYAEIKGLGDYECQNSINLKKMWKERKVKFIMKEFWEEKRKDGNCLKKVVPSRSKATPPKKSSIKQRLNLFQMEKTNKCGKKALANKNSAKRISDGQAAHKEASAGIIGAYFDPRRSSWRVKRWSKAKKMDIFYGSYKDIEEAARASDKLARELMESGERGHNLNFPFVKNDYVVLDKTSAVEDLGGTQLDSNVSSNESQKTNEKSSICSKTVEEPSRVSSLQTEKGKLTEERSRVSSLRTERGKTTEEPSRVSSLHTEQEKTTEEPTNVGFVLDGQYQRNVMNNLFLEK